MYKSERSCESEKSEINSKYANSKNNFRLKIKNTEIKNSNDNLTRHVENENE